MVSNVLFSQEFKQVKVGQTFNLSYPSSYSKVFNLNESASIQLSNIVQDKYLIVIQEEKEALKSLQVNFANIDEAAEFYSKNIISSIPENKNKKISSYRHFKINGYNATELTIDGDVEVDEDGKFLTIAYKFVLAETPNYYYQFLFWSDVNKREKYNEEFEKILSSFKETN